MYGCDRVNPAFLLAANIKPIIGSDVMWRYRKKGAVPDAHQSRFGKTPKDAERSS